MSLVFNAYSGVIATIIFITTKTSSESSIEIPHRSWVPWVLLLLACLLFSMYERLRFKVAQLLDVGIYSTISSIYVPIVFFISAVIYKEVVTINKLIGFLLITIGILLISINKNTIVGGINKLGVTIGLIAYTFLGIAGSLDKKGSEFFSADIYNLLVWIIPIIFIYLPYIPISDIKKEILTGSWKIPLLSAVNVLGYLFMLKAFVLAEATKVIAIVNSSILPSLILGILVLKERDHIAKKFIAGVLALLGIIILG